ncbi:MP domain-containing protein [Cephalotus follicularis]|uniref:MP domain-containing protein n=1 Tax=Cephalotus follicularis TaxID=3775 RepID=A0A1Q3BBW9_CEPFO|nr:MP domain-containing protein [Cephalotus follicularis]
MSSRSYSGSKTSNNSNRDKELDERIKQWQNWKPPKISNKEIYKYNPFNPFNFTERIQTIEQTIKVTKTQQNIQLLDEKTIKELAKNFKYIHFGLVQVTIKPLTRQGLNTSILVCLRDARHLNFDDSLIGAIETSLCNGHVYFDGYPDLTISLTDLTISLVNLLKSEITMMKCVTNDSNILIPQKIKWSDIKDWSIQSDTIAPNQENIENASLHSITQNEEGLVKNRTFFFSNTIFQKLRGYNLEEIIKTIQKIRCKNLFNNFTLIQDFLRHIILNPTQFPYISTGQFSHYLPRVA